MNFLSLAFNFRASTRLTVLRNGKSVLTNLDSFQNGIKVADPGKHSHRDASWNETSDVCRERERERRIVSFTRPHQKRQRLWLSKRHWPFPTQWRPRFTQFSSRIGHFYHHLGGHGWTGVVTWKLSCVNRRVSVGQERRKVVELYRALWTGFICSGQANPPPPSGSTSLFSLTVPYPSFIFIPSPPPFFHSFLFQRKLWLPRPRPEKFLRLPAS